MHGIHNTNSQIKFKTTMLKSSLCDYSDAYKLVKGTKNHCWRRSKCRSKQVVFKNQAPFTDCITEISKTQIDNAKDLEIVMLMDNV